MTAAGALAILLGLAILVIVVADVFATVLHHWGNTGPIGRAVTHATWRAALHATAWLAPRRRRYLLGLVGPALIPIIVGLWALLIVLGFALLYYPGMPDGFDRWDRALPIRGAFGDAFYFSGYTFFTLGYGDIAPITNTLRVLAVLQSGSGFALITFVLSYFVSVYDAYRHKTVLAESIHFQTGGTGDAAELIARQYAPGLHDPTVNVPVERLRDGLVRLRSDYSNYPILHFFREQDPERSYLRLLFVSSDLALLLDTALDPERSPAAAGLGERSGLAAAAAASSRSLLTAMVRQIPEEVDTRDAERHPHYAAWTARFERARDGLAAAGVPLNADPAAVGTYAAGRAEWEPVLRPCAEALGEDWDEVRGG